MSFVDPQTELELTESETVCSLGHVHHKDLDTCPSCDGTYSEQCFINRVQHNNQKGE